ncbi:MAG: transposase [Deltaproteobacteria bacterium]|nr:transposase [Deltaproteobacteria bacterium]MCX7953198.1 transposase [Deltaproteobacteria bacterium]
MTSKLKYLVTEIMVSVNQCYYKEEKEVLSDDREKVFLFTEMGLKEFKDKWNGKYQDVVAMSEKDFQCITSFLKYPFELGRLITTTNVIKSVNSKLQKVLYAKRSIPKETLLRYVIVFTYI